MAIRAFYYQNRRAVHIYIAVFVCVLEFLNICSNSLLFDLMVLGKRRRGEDDKLMLFAPHPVFVPLSIWYFTDHRIRQDVIRRKLRSMALAIIFITKLW